MTLIDIGMTLAYIIFSACPSSNHIFSSELWENVKYICSHTILRKVLQNTFAN